MRAFRWLLTRLVLFVAASLSEIEGAPPPPVELIADTTVLQPTTTLEFRFSKPIVAREEVGISPQAPPILITPEMPGKFTWLSRSSGVFVPEGPLPLGLKYTIVLRKGLQWPDGKPVGAMRWMVETPRFGQTATKNPTGGDEALPARPRVMLAYNLPLDLSSAEGLFQFVDSKGRKVAAKVRHATRRDYFHLPPEQRDWEERWRAAQAGGAALPDNESEDEADDDSGEDPSDYGARGKPIPSQLAIAPVEPLSPGAPWRLEIRRGLRSRVGKYRIDTPQAIALGVVRPFEIKELVPSSYINSGRSVTVNLSESLAPDILPDHAAKYFRVEPEVANAKFDGFDSSFTISGDFQLGQEYRLIAGDGVISYDGVPLQGERTKAFRFAPVAPRLYLPEITAHQIRSGRRKFEVLSANLKALRVIARLVSVGSVAQAVNGFDAYNSEDNSLDEPFQPLPAGTIQGEILHEQTIDLPAGPIDARQVTTLDWDQIVGARKAGVIFLTVEGVPRPDIEGKRVGAQSLIQLTDLGVLWKQISEGLWVTVFSMADGKPVDAARAVLLDAEFNQLSTGKADASGNANLAIPAKPAWLVVSKADDVHAFRVGPGESELPMAAFRLPIDYLDWEQPGRAAPSLRAMIFTDRPLYRPGETVRIKGLVRALEGGPAKLEGIPGLLKLRGPRDYEAPPIEVVTNANGSFDASVALPTETNGGYSLQLTFPESPAAMWQRGMTCRFTVADFQPDAFAVNLDLPSRFAPETPIKTSVSAAYLFGAPVTEAGVKWTLQYLTERFSPEGFSAWQFGDETDAAGKTLVLNGEGTLTGTTPMVIEPQLPGVSHAPARGVLTVEVTDLNQQTVSSSRMFTRDSAEFYLGQALPEGVVFRAGSEITTRAIAVSPTGEPLSVPMDVKAELFYVRFDTVRVQGAGKAVTFRTEKTEEPVGEARGRTLVPTFEQDSWVVREGDTVRFKAERAGQYRIRLTANDGKGRTAVSVMQFYVSGQDEVGWDYRNPAQVDLIPDRQEYRPGDTAKIMVKAPISGEAWVTIERGARILRTLPVRLEGNSPLLEVPITADDQPNIFVSLVVVRGLEQSTRKHKTAEYRYGATMLRVGDPKARLQVELKPAKPEVQPREEVVTSVLVTNGQGEPVPDAEVTFWAPDDGILSITGYERPMPGDVFGAPFPLAVRTGITLMNVLPEDPTALAFSNKGYLIGGGGLEGPGLKLRTDFPGTACWFPSLRTGPDGRVLVRFRAPDALTRYRVVAVANSDKLFGSAESSFTIRKPLMITPSLGQFANVGDELVARAVVRNDSGADAEVSVALTLDSLAEPTTAGTPLSAKLQLRNGDARAVDFPIRIKNTGIAEWKWEARLQTAGKALEDQTLSTLRINSPTPTLRETYVADLRQASTNLLEGVNPQLLEGSGTVDIAIANTRLGMLRESVTQLLEYPYGCAEQTISSVIPWLLTKELSPVIPELAKPEAEIRTVIRKGLDRLFAMQTSNGGIAMWPGDCEPSLFISAYAALACAMLPAESPELPPGQQALRTYLEEQLRGMALVRDERGLGDRALVLYAQALRQEANAAYVEELYRRRKELSHESRALLALAIRESGGAEKMVDELLNRKTAAPEAFSFFAGPARERAIQLIAWSAHKPRANEVARLVKELLGYQVNAHWTTTQQNAWALLALARCYTASESGEKATSGAITAGKRETPFQLSPDKPSFSTRIGFNPATPLASLTVGNPSKGVLFSESRFIVRPPVGNQPRQDRGYSVSRSYQKLSGDGSVQPAEDLKVGDRILVTLRVETPRPGHFVAIDDPLPGVLEALNPAFKSRGIAGGDGVAKDWVSDYSEVRADRVLYFCDHLPAGAYTFRYLARVRSAGSTIAGPTKAEEMYRPERFGLGESTRLEAHPVKAQ